MEVSKKGKRNTIQYLWKQGKTGSEILNELAVLYGDDRPSKTSVYKWINRFKKDRGGTTEDLTRTGRPRSVTNKDNIHLVESILEDDSGASIRQIEESTGISRNSIQRIIKNNLELTHTAGKWEQQSPESDTHRFTCDFPIPHTDYDATKKQEATQEHVANSGFILFNCVVCYSATTGAHCCPGCKLFIHSICGRSNGDPNDVWCPKCDQTNKYSCI